MRDITDDVDFRVSEHLTNQRLQVEVDRKIALAEAYGKDVYDEGQVFRFQKTFDEGGHAYTYAAIKVANRWYTTGPQGQVLTWDQFVVWLISGPNPTKPEHVEMLSLSGYVDLKRGLAQAMEYMDRFAKQREEDIAHLKLSGPGIEVPDLKSRPKLKSDPQEFFFDIDRDSSEDVERRQAEKPSS